MSTDILRCYKDLLDWLPKQPWNLLYYFVIVEIGNDYIFKIVLIEIWM